MTRVALLRRALWATAFLNAGGAVLFFFPASVGQLVPMPLPAPILYSWFCAAVIAIFSGVYAWLALQQRPSRPFLIVGATGKTAFFVICMVSWIIGESSGRIMAIASLDMVLAAIFFACMPEEVSGNALRGE